MSTSIQAAEYPRLQWPSLTHSLVDHSDIFLLHCAWSCDISCSWMYSQPVHSSMSCIHCLLGLPWCRSPSMIPSRTVSANCPALPGVMWPKYCTFSFATLPINSLSRPNSVNIELFVRCSCHELLSIFLQHHISLIVAGIDLKWTKHIDAVVSKAASRLYFLKQLRRADAPARDLLHFYTTVVRPVLEYACPVWHPGLTLHTLNCSSRCRSAPSASPMLTSTTGPPWLSLALRSALLRLFPPNVYVFHSMAAWRIPESSLWNDAALSQSVICLSDNKPFWLILILSQHLIQLTG